mmetsp:Transcript_34786/g.62180  ORF Transcript_34786/g.62180 Transcript_34786/m.62180 type:complete len:85 (-) Transcript_34786:566-820(-)
MMHGMCMEYGYKQTPLALHQLQGGAVQQVTGRFIGRAWAYFWTSATVQRTLIQPLNAGYPPTIIGLSCGHLMAVNGWGLEDFVN